MTFGVIERVYVHYIWATWDRAPMLESDDVRHAVHACIAAKCTELRCDAVAVGGIADHVHLLARLHRTVPMADLVRDAKGSSSHLANHHYSLSRALRWQRGYAAISVSPSRLDRVKSYISRQAEHHRRGTLIDVLEEFDFAASDSTRERYIPPPPSRRRPAS